VDTLIIKRIEFVGFMVIGPRSLSRGYFKPDEWHGWTATEEADAVWLRGEGKAIRLPLSLCAITYAVDGKPAAKPKSRTVITAKAKAVEPSV